jgi:hypothetical protein
MTSTQMAKLACDQPENKETEAAEEEGDKEKQ